MILIIIAAVFGNFLYLEISMCKKLHCLAHTCGNDLILDACKEQLLVQSLQMALADTELSGDIGYIPVGLRLGYDISSQALEKLFICNIVAFGNGFFLLEVFKELLYRAFKLRRLLSLKLRNICDKLRQMRCVRQQPAHFSFCL